MKKYICLFVITFALNTTAFSQSDCEAAFTSGDVYRWRGQLNFLPKSMTIEKMNYIINNLSDRAYNQMRIEIRVNCRDIQVKNNLIQNMKYFWDNKITEIKLSTYFPAYYIFYQLDKSGSGSSVNYPSEPKLNTPQNEIKPYQRKGPSNDASTDLFLTHLLNEDIINKSSSDIISIFTNKPTNIIKDSRGNKCLYWEESQINVLFKFGNQDQCIYFNIIPTSHDGRERISNYLSSYFVHLSSVKWYNKAFNYYIQLILEEQDHFICFKDLKDLDKE